MTAYGLLMSAIEGTELTVGGVLARGLLFGVLMTLANEFWLRRRYERG